MAASTSSPGFIFSADGKSAPSYDQLQKRRRVLDSLLERQAGARAPQTIGEGIHALGQGIVAGIQGRQLRKDEEALAERQQQIWGNLSAFGGQSGVAAPNFGAGAGYGSATGPISDASPTPSGSMVAASDLAPYQAALLDTISGPESAGAYDVIYGGSKFADFSDHPRKAVPIGSGPNQGKTSSAAGRYQFLGSTWDQYRDKLGLRDFSPANQDKAAYALAADTYRQKTGQDLDAVLQSGDPDAIAGVGSALSGVWTSLPGGIEQGTNTNRFVSAFSNSLGRYGSRPASQDASAPVQVASLDPSAGVAEATAPNARANASISTMPSTPSDVPVPSSSPRAALERAAATQAQRSGQTGTQPYTGPAESSPDTTSSIAPLGMPGSSPQTDAAIQQYHAVNGSTPMRYQGGAQAEPEMVAAPGSVADQRADAIIAGDPERPIVSPMPTPRPDMGQQAAGIPPQAVAASAMAQQPVPYDPVNGTAMGGNTGAADAAKAAYLEANGGTPAVQRIAQVMNERGISAQPSQPADPVRAKAVQRVATAQNQAQAQGRFGQLMQIMMDPSASPEQKQVAGMYLEQDRQFQTQQQARDWEMLKLRESRAYDERKAERDRAAGNEDYLARKKIDLQYQKPEGVDWQELPNGDYGYFDPLKREFTRLGSAPKADNGGITVSPDGTVQIGGGVKMPANFMPDANQPGTVKPIPGGPGEQLPAEFAGRVGIADSFLGQAPALREKLGSGAVTGMWDRAQAGNNASSEQAGIYRQLQSGADALQRLLTGAGLTESEAAAYAGRYLPGYTDDAASVVSKLDQMVREIENVRAASLRGRGGNGASVTPNGPTGAPRTAPPSNDYRTRYGLE